MTNLDVQHAQKRKAVARNIFLLPLVRHVYTPNLKNSGSVFQPLVRDMHTSGNIFLQSIVRFLHL